MIFSSFLFPLLLLVLLGEATVLKHFNQKSCKKKIDNSEKTLAFSIATSDTKRRIVSEEDTACLKALGLANLCSFIDEQLLASSQKSIFWTQLLTFSTLEGKNATLVDVLLWITDLESETNSLDFADVISLLKLVAFLKGEKIPSSTDSIYLLIKFQRLLEISLSYSQLLSLSKAITLSPTKVIMDFSECFHLTRIPNVARLLNFIFAKFSGKKIARGTFQNMNLTEISISHLRSNPVYNFNLVQMIEANSVTLQRLCLLNVHVSDKAHQCLVVFEDLQSLNIRTFYSEASRNWVFPVIGKFRVFEVPSLITVYRDDLFMIDRKESILYQSTTAFLRSNPQLETLSIDCNFAGLETAEFKGAIKSLSNLKSLSMPINGNIQEYLSDSATFSIERLSFLDYNSFATCQNWNFIASLENLKFFGMHSDFVADEAFFNFVRKDQLQCLSISKKQFSESEMGVFAEALAGLKSLKALALNISNEYHFNLELSSEVDALFVDLRRVRSTDTESPIRNLPRGVGVKYLFLIGDIDEVHNSTFSDHLKRQINLNFPNLIKLKVKGHVLEAERPSFEQIYDLSEPIYGAMEIAPGMFF